MARCRARHTPHLSTTMNMNKKQRAKVNDRIFIIEPDLPEVGAYLRIYENDKDVADYLQNSVQDCIDFAQEEFGVLTDAWSEME